MIAQLVEHCTCVASVTSSNRFQALLCQLESLEIISNQHQQNELKCHYPAQKTVRINKSLKRPSFCFLSYRVIVFLSFSESSLHFFDQVFYSSLALIHRHAGVLGLASCVQAFPYDVPSWMPQILLDLGDHLHDPHPIQVREMEEGLLCIGFCRPCNRVL